MTGQLARVQQLLTTGNVPCEMKRLRSGDPVLAVGVPASGTWEVLVGEADGELWIQHRGTVGRLPAGCTDQDIADAVKYRIVQSWADQGDPQAKALLAAIGDRYDAATAARHGRPPVRSTVRAPVPAAQPVMRSVTAQFSPWGFALKVTDSGPGESIPTSWAWQWGLGPTAVTDYYQRFFSEMRNNLMGARGTRGPEPQ